MKRRLFFNLLPGSLVVLCLLLIGISSCKKETLVETTSLQVNITGYLDKNPDQFSEWRKILEITGNAGFLQAYGNYTMFLPTNDGVAKYLKDMGKTSVEQLDLAELKSVVRFHLLEDTINSRKFTDGKLSTLTMLGQYLITGTATAAGVTSIVINRQANIVKPNIRLGNGYVHVLDNVLRPAKLTLAQMIEANPKYSILTQALKETGLYDSLNFLPAANPKTDQKFLTVLAESDAVMAAAGYSTYAALKAKYNTGVPNLKDANNGLHIYVAYHIIYDSKYLVDLAATQGHKTISGAEIITTKYLNQQVIINDVEFNGSYEPGVVLDPATSDNSASNGVLHATAPYNYNYTYKNAAGNSVTATGTSSGQFEVKVRVPFSVFWDVADFPEARAFTNSFQKPGIAGPAFNKSSATAASPIKGWNWPKTGNGCTYNPNATPNFAPTATDPWVNHDYLNMFLGIVSGNARQEWIDMKTPLVVRGKYHVWICWKRQLQNGAILWPANVGTTARVRIDGGDPSPKVFSFGEAPPVGSSAELEGLGWKYYTSTGDPANPFTKIQYDGIGQALNEVYIGKDLGIMDIKTTDFHTLRMEATFGSQSTNNLDMIHFIPVTASSQILPRFKNDGTMDFTAYP